MRTILLFIIAVVFAGTCTAQTTKVHVTNNNIGTKNYGKTSTYTVKTERTGIDYGAYTSGASKPTPSTPQYGNAASNGFVQGYNNAVRTSNYNAYSGIWAAKRAKHRRNIAKLRIKLISTTNKNERSKIIDKIWRKQKQLNRILNY